MRRLRLLAILTALAIAVPPGIARAQDRPSPETMAMAEEFFSLLFEGAIGQLNAQAVENAWPGIEQSVRARNPSIEAATIAALRGEYERIRLGRLRSLLKDMPAVYARHLSKQEMQEAIAFYRTPTGQKILRVVPGVLTEALASVLPYLPAAIAETHDAFLKLLRERALLP